MSHEHHAPPGSCADGAPPGWLGTAQPRDRRAEAIIDALLEADATGRSWLPGLLGCVPRARERLGELVQRPGTVQMALSMRGLSGRRGCFEMLAPAPPALLRWFIDHPEQLRWPADARLSREEAILRRALLCDQPPGARARAQERAHEALAKRSALARGWWRFEAATRLDCVLMTEELVLAIDASGRGALEPVSPWYAQRPRLMRTLEGARDLAEGRAWAVLLIGEEELTEASAQWLAERLPAAAPHLDQSDRAELLGAYLGSLTWSAAVDAAGLDVARIAPAGGG